MTRSNQTRDQFARGAAKVDPRPMAMSGPGTAFRCEPGDIKIARNSPVDGTTRTKETALVVARRRDAGATYRGSDARWFVFRAGER